MFSIAAYPVWYTYSFIYGSGMQAHLKSHNALLMQYVIKSLVLCHKQVQMNIIFACKIVIFSYQSVLTYVWLLRSTALDK